MSQFFNMFSQGGMQSAMMMQAVFSYLDKDGDGFLDFEEVMMALQQIGLGFLGQTVVLPAFQMVDTDGNELIDFDEFNSLVEMLQNVRSQFSPAQ
ncbi:hypothetical protein ACOME3_005514 [Neoechinorhynchus agilis]